MANEIGTTLLNSLTNSTFDIGNMSKVLAEAEVAGPKAILESNRERANTELDALKYLDTNLTAFNTYVSELSSPDLFQQLSATSSNEEIVAVSATSGAMTGSYQIESTKLAQTHTTVFDSSFTSTLDSIADSTLSFTVGGQQQTIDINAANSNNTLEGLQQYLNNGDFGVSAAVINNGSGYQLMLTSQTSGAAGEIVFGSTPAELGTQTTTSVAQDAEMVLNGFTVTSNTNTFDEVIEGVSFTLNAAAIGTSNSITIDQSTENVDEAIRSFVDVYNQLDTIFDELGSYDSSSLTEEELASDEYQFYGDLAGSSLLRTVRDQIRSTMSGALDGLNSNFNSLAQVGISFDREGQLSIDEEVYSAALENNLSGIEAIFAKAGSSDSNLINFTGTSDRTLAGDYDISITQAASRAQWTITSPDSDGVDGDVDISGNGSFSISVDGSTTVNLNIADGEYSMQEFATLLADTINNSTEVSASGSSVSVAIEAGNFVLFSDKYGVNSSLNLAGASFANVGDPALESGQNVVGTITTDQGSLSLGAYVDSSDGRKINISDFAVIGGEAAEVRGLEFEVRGVTNSTLSVTQGFASRIEEVITNLFEDENGLVPQRMDSLNAQNDRYDEKEEKLDARYDRLLLKYQVQFSTLQSLLSSAEQTRDYLTATFNRDN